MQNYDIKQAKRQLYAPRQTFEIVDVPPLNFFMADGEGNPNTSPRYRAAVQALYATAYAVRALAIKEVGKKHTVGPLEGLWWADDLRVFTSRDKNEWKWRLMITQPDWVTEHLFTRGLDNATRKHELVADVGVRFDQFHEGTSVQVLHIGPYDDEGPTIARMHDEFMPEHGLRPRGKHHEIYLSDARRADPARLRTIIRQPVEPANA